MKKKTFLLLPALALVFSLAACTGNTPTPTPDPEPTPADPGEGEGGGGGEVDPPVTEVTLSSITLSGNYQTEFEFDEPFSYSGLVVTATYSDATSKAVTGYQVSSPDMSTAGTKDVTVSYTEKEVTKTASYQITVKEQEVPPEPPVVEYDFYVAFGDEVIGAIKQVYDLVENQVAEYVVGLGSVEKDDLLSILDSNKTPLTENFGAEPGENNVVGEANPFRIHNDSVNTKVYIKVWESGWTNFFVSGYEADVQTEFDFYVQYGGEEIGVVKQTYELSSPEQLAEYKVDLGDVKENDAISILNAEKVVMSENFGAEPGENNVKGEANPFAIHNDASNVSVYIKTWASGWVNFYVSGYVAGGDPLPPEPPVDDDIPAEEGFYVVGTASEWKFAGATKMVMPGSENGDLAELKGYEAKAGEEFKIRSYLAGEKTWYNLEDSTDNYIVGDVDRVLDIYVNASGVVYVFDHNGGDPLPPEPPVDDDIPAEEGFYVVGTASEWKFAGATKMDMPGSENGDLAELKGYEAKAGEEFKIRSYLAGEKTWYNLEDSTDNYVVGEADKVLDIYVNASGVVYVFDHDGGDPLPPEPPVEVSYKIVGSMNSWDYETSTFGFTDYNVEEEIAQGQYVSQLKGLFPVTTEESFKVSDGTNWYGVSATEAGYQYAHDDSGAFSTDKDGNIVVSGEGTVTVFFKTFEGGAHGMYVAFEGTAAPITPATNATFEITGVPSWYPNDGAKVFVWAWGGDLGSGAWIQCALTENATDCTLSFEAPENITGFLVARCHADTVTPDWNVTDNEAGKVYNQSKDVTVSKGVTSYIFEAA